ncbi:hypothetical protein C8R48DRAFT_90303 [Suillus tomentosus]|nr:hypothetical protein C8R48DRAFT_90303 [Suillus tomentosus]
MDLFVEYGSSELALAKVAVLFLVAVVRSRGGSHDEGSWSCYHTHLPRQNIFLLMASFTFLIHRPAWIDMLRYLCHGNSFLNSIGSVMLWIFRTYCILLFVNSAPSLMRFFLDRPGRPFTAFWTMLEGVWGALPAGPSLITIL